jgi:hypothetical protein
MEYDTITSVPETVERNWPDPRAIKPTAPVVGIAHETAMPVPLPHPARSPDLELLGNQIAELSARIDAATYELLCQLREFDHRYGWEGWRSCAHWLNWRTGLNLGAAREKLRVAAALADLNHIAAAMACGKLSYSKVRALTRVATPATEARLLAVALGTTAAQVERLVRGWRQADRDAQEDGERALLASRTLNVQVDADGMVVVRGRLPPEVGAVLMRAVEAALEQVPVTDDDEQSTTAQRRADALGLVAESALAGGLDPGNPGDRFQVMVHVQADALAIDASASREMTVAQPRVSAETRGVDPVRLVDLETDLDAGQAVIEQAGGLHLGREAARRVACDAGLVVLHHAGSGEVLDVGRKTRAVPTALRRALQSRDHSQCQFPGCDSRHCDAHHVEHWADGGETRLTNLVSLCRFHHRAVHEAGFRVVPGDAEGQFRFLRPNGEPIPAQPPAVTWEGAPLAPTDARLAAASISIGPDTATPEWYGEPLHLPAALDVLWEPPAPDRLKR